MTTKKVDNTIPEGFTESKAKFAKWENVGDTVQGLYVERKLIDNRMKEPTVKQALYRLLQDDGSLIYVAGRGQSDPQVIGGMEDVKIGERVILRFTEELPSKKAGFKGTKVIKVFRNNIIDQEALAKYRGDDIIDLDKIEM